jgi:hypothetical protein
MAQSLDNKSFATFDAPRRNRFYYGKLLDVFHLEMEQDYGRLMRALSNRLTAGAGVLCGLGISIDGDRVCIDPGVAIDRLGREIILPHHACIDPWGDDPACPCCPPSPPRSRDVEGVVTIELCYRECGVDWGPALIDDCGGGPACEAGTTVETWCLRLVDGRPDPRGPFIGCEALSGYDPAQSRDERIRLRRQRLCEVLSDGCNIDMTDICIPLAVVQLLQGGRIGTVEVCAVRERLYLSSFYALPTGSRNAAPTTARRHQLQHPRQLPRQHPRQHPLQLQLQRPLQLPRHRPVRHSGPSRSGSSTIAS